LINSNNIKITRKIKLTSVIFLWLALFVDLGGALAIKYIALAAFFILASINIPDSRLNRSAFIIIFMFLVWPVFSLILGLLKEAPLTTALSQITPFICALLILQLYPNYDLNRFLYGFYISGAVLALLIHVIYLFWIVQPTYWVSFFSSFGGDLHGKFGIKEVSGISIPGIYFRSTLLLVPCFLYFYLSRAYILASIIFLALLLAWSKAGVVICIIFSIIMTFDSKLNSRIGKKVFFLFLIFVISMIVIFTTNMGHVFVEAVLTTLSGSNYTASIRIEHFFSILTLICNEPLILIFGQGLGVPFYTSAYNEYVTNTELDHLNLLRKFGLIWLLFFLGILVDLFLTLRNSNNVLLRNSSWPIIAAFIACGTNPILSSPLFLMYFTLLVSSASNENKF
jgi:hypothetical protein